MAAIRKKKIAVEDIEYLIRKLAEFNKLNLNQIHLTENGKNIDMNNLEEFRCMGLSNKDYINLRFWEIKHETYFL